MTSVATSLLSIVITPSRTHTSSVSSVDPDPAARNVARVGSIAKKGLATATTRSDKRDPSALCFVCFTLRAIFRSSRRAPARFGIRVVYATSLPPDEQFQSLFRENHLSVSSICHTFLRVSGYTSQVIVPPFGRSLAFSTLTPGIESLVNPPLCFCFPFTFTLVKLLNSSPTSKLV